jgi:hypothetical protein
MSRIHAPAGGATNLVRVNLGMLANDERLGRAAELAQAAARARDRAPYK